MNSLADCVRFYQIAQDFCSYSRCDIWRIVGYITDAATLEMEKKTSKVVNFLRETALLLFGVLLTLSPFATAQEIKLGNFSSGNLENWQSKEFAGQTSYRIAILEGIQVLRADSKASASGLFKKQRIDLRNTPYLNWSWRINTRLIDLNERKKNGDDYAARLYVVIDGGLLFWNTIALNYVWSSNTDKGQIWPNAFAGKNTMMVALRSSQDQLNTWYSEKRNIQKDLLQLYGENFRYIDAIAVMTDTDNSRGQATAYYGDIFFSVN